MPMCAHVIFGREQRQRESTGEAMLAQLLSVVCGYLQITIICGFFFGGPAQTSMGLGDPIAQVRTRGSPACSQLEWGPPWSTLFVSAVNCDDRVQVTRD